MKKTILGRARKLIYKIKYMYITGTEPKRYYIIYRHDDTAGLGSYFITNLGQIKYARTHNMVPIVDMQYFENVYQDPKDYCKVNTWEYFFDQSDDVTSLEDAYKSKNYLFCVNGVSYPKVCIETLRDEIEIRAWHEVYEKNIRIRAAIKASSDLFVKEHFSQIQNMGGKIAGVMLRGTDYFSLKPIGHPIQPTAQIAIEIIKKKKLEWGLKKIFLVTEDITIQRAFMREFGSDIILPNACMYEYEDGKYVGDIISSRDNDRYLHGKEYLESLILLGKCDYFISGITSGCICARIMSEGFEDEYYFDLGVY